MLRLRFARSFVLGLLASGAFFGCDSGGSATATGGVTPRLEADYGLRRDVRLSDDQPADVGTFDLDGDGLVDLAVANSIARDVAVSFGMPDGSFETPLFLATRGVPWRSGVGDFDNDGLLDLAVLSFDGTNGASAGVDVFLQGPPRTFAPPITRASVGNPNDIAVARSSGIVGDPVADELFVTIAQTQTVERLQLFGSNLTLVETLDSSVLGTAGRAFSLTTFDEYADGTLDLAVAEAQIGASELGRILVYPRTGQTFGPPRIVFDPVYWPTIDNVGDVDGDGTEDLAVAQVDGSDVIVLYGTTNVGADPASQLVPFGPGTTSVVFTDLDADGLTDAAASVFQEAALYVRMAIAPGVWAEPTLYDVGFLPRSLSVVELPGDAFPDLVVANVFDTALLTNDGTGRFRAARGTVLSHGSPKRIAVADLDLDGDQDVAVLTIDEPAVLLLRNEGGGTFREWGNCAIEQGTPYDIAIVPDGDGDGFPNPVVSLPDRDELFLVHNPFSLASFTQCGEAIAAGDGPRDLAVADLDQDGSFELLVTLGEGRALQVFTLDNDAYVSAGMDPLSGKGMTLGLADLDEDGDLDALVTTGEPGTSVPAPDPEARLLVLEWTGNQFQERNAFALDSISTSFDAGQLTLDRNADVVVAQQGQGQHDLLLFEGDGNFGFQRREIALPTVPSSVRLADLNDDGRLDLFVPSINGELLFAFGNGRGDFPTLGRGAAGDQSLVFGMLGGFDAADVDEDPMGLADFVYVSPNAPVLWVAPNTSRSL